MAYPALGQFPKEVYGDFAETCCPQTYEAYCKRKTTVANQPHKDPFDMFLADRFPFFAYLVNQYYARRRPGTLQFRALAYSDRIQSLDELLARCITGQEPQSHHMAEEFFRFVLEEALVGRAVGDSPSAQVSNLLAPR